jgi:PAS domain S-box-containing protein
MTTQQQGPPEEWLRLLVDTLGDHAIFMLDPDGRIATWNRGAEAINGYSAAEIIGQHFSRFYPRPAVIAGKCEHELAVAARTGRYEEEGWRIRKDGSRFWAGVVITALRDATGTLVGFGTVTRDLTERWHALETLRHSEERFRLIVEQVKDYAIFMLDAEGRVATWNAGAQRIKGYTADEIIGHHFSQFYPEPERRSGKTEEELALAIRDGRFEEEGWRVRKDGSRFWASVVITALRDATGVLRGFAKVTRDLTERRKLEEERLKAAVAEEGVRLRDEFLSIAAHELRTPLSSLLLQLESLGDRIAAVDDDAARRLIRAIRSGERLSQLIESLLDVSRIATGKLELQRARFDLCAAVGDVVESMRAAADAARCPLHLRRCEEAVVGSWDRLRVDQVVTNLLANAFRYAAGTAVEVEVRREGDTASIAVRDHGAGITEADRERIFRRFERGVSMRHYGGMGLGLYLVQQIAQAHGGVAAADNMPDGGARVTVRIPLAEPA